MRSEDPGACAICLNGLQNLFRHCLTSVLLASLGVLTCMAAQPIPFPHDKHMHLGLACIDCHTGADSRAAAGIPSVRKCMLCHAKILNKDPQVQKVIAYADKKIEIPWVRVYGFSPGAHVQFRHAPHYQAGVPCTRCHGDLTKMGVAERVVNHNMGTCLTCHRQNNAPEDCAACHY